MTPLEALKLTREKDLDLVEVSPNTTPPVCKMLDFGKYKYELSKKLKEIKHKKKTIELKEIKIRPKIENHDFNVKSKKTREFIEDGDRVKISVVFRGREMAYTNLGKDIMERMLKELEDIAAIELQPKIEGKNMIMVLCPKTDKK
jgi:translation initiation factor IF-3